MRRLIAFLFCLMLPIGASAQQATQMLNGFRAENGLGPLKPSKILEQTAMTHARDMANNRFFSHTGSDGSKPIQRAKRKGYRPCIVAENIAKASQPLTAVLGEWARRPGHRKNMLLPQIKEYGLVRYEGDIWVLVLGGTSC